MDRSTVITMVVILCIGAGLGYGLGRLAAAPGEPAVCELPLMPVEVPESPPKIGIPDEVATELGWLRRENQTLKQQCAELEEALTQASEKLAAKQDWAPRQIQQ